MAIEANTQKKITAHLKQNKCFYFKIIAASVNGIPDIFAVINDQPVFIEVKAPGGKLSEIQKYQINRLIMNGIRVKVVYSFKEYLDYFNARLMDNSLQSHL